MKKPTLTPMLTADQLERLIRAKRDIGYDDEGIRDPDEMADWIKQQLARELRQYNDFINHDWIKRVTTAHLLIGDEDTINSMRDLFGDMSYMYKIRDQKTRKSRFVKRGDLTLDDIASLQRQKDAHVEAATNARKAFEDACALIVPYLTANPGTTWADAVKALQPRAAAE